MDHNRALDIAQVTNAMDVTRESIRNTVDELKARVHESADWRYHVTARPIASPLMAAAGGLAAARILMPAARLARIPLFFAPRLVRRPPPSELAGSWARLFGAAGPATQLAALPSLVSQIRQVVRRPGGKTRC